jgi:hypothetical protein
MTTEILSSSSTNVKIRPGKYDHKVFDWLIEGGRENINERNDENTIDKVTNNEMNNSIFKTNSKEELLQESLFEEEESYKENSSQEETEETFQSSAGSSSSSLYTAELIAPHRSIDSNSSKGSNGSIENEISSPIKPLKAVTTPTTSTLNSTSNVYEILQEIKPDHPFRIHTQFDFTYLRPPPSPSISLNPLLHHHRNSTYNPRISINYIPPRRYSNFQRQSFYNDNNGISVKRQTLDLLPRVKETDNNFIISQLPANEKNEKNRNLLQEEKIMYGKYLFWAGFLFIPVWWVGCFYKPTSTEDYKWRKRCRKASSLSFVILIVVLTFIVIIEQRLKIGI